MVTYLTLNQTWKLARCDVALSRESRLWDFEEVCEDDEFLEAERAVGVDAVVHGGVVAHLVGARALTVGPEHSGMYYTHLLIATGIIKAAEELNNSTHYTGSRMI